MTTRRALGLLAAGALSTTILLKPDIAIANSAEEVEVATAVEALREAIFNRDRAKLEELTAKSLSYGLPGGRSENKLEFVSAALGMGRQGILKSLKWTDVKIAVTGTTAIVRHGSESIIEANGNATETKLAVMQVWQKFDGKWQLYAHQAFRLAP